MIQRRDPWVSLAAISGLLAVAAGAFAAHAVKDAAARELLRTGAAYQSVHALAAIVVSLASDRLRASGRRAPPLFLAGTAFFSGSLYALAFGAPRVVGMLTPIGGLLFTAGWATLAWAARDWPAKTVSPPPGKPP